MAESDVDQFYRARGLDTPNVITDDRRCLQCGNALKGLRVGDSCPRCGRRVLRDRATGLNEVPVRVLVRLRTAVSLALLSWLAGMALWIWCYYGLWSNAGPVLSGVFCVVVIPAVFMTTRTWTAVEAPPEELWRSSSALMSLTLVVAVILLGLLLFAQSPLTPEPSVELMLGLVSVTAFVWIGLQALACLLFARIAAQGADSRLADRYFNLSWALGLGVAFISPYLAVTQAIQGRSGMVPVCCLSGYLVVIGFFVAQLMFAVSTIRLRGIINWAIRYRDQYDGKTAEMVERIEAGRRAGDSEGTAYLRD